MFLILRGRWAMIFNDDPEVASLVAHILPMVAGFQIFDGIASATNGMLRATGKQVSFPPS